MRPFIIYNPGQPHRKRQAKPKVACKKCGAKRVPAGRAKAICEKCLKAGSHDSSSQGSGETISIGRGNSTNNNQSLVPWDDDSSTEYGFNLLHNLSVGMHKTDAEGETLDRFLRRFVPSMGIFFDGAFFTNWILPATQGNAQVFDAALAVTTFHELPMNDIWADMSERVYDRYHLAMKWYRQSLRASIEYPPDKESPQSIAVSLITIILYMGIEIRQLNWAAQEGLMQAAFAIIHSGRAKIKDSKSEAIMICMGLIMDFTVLSAIAPYSIKIEHWETASALAYNLCEGCKAGGNLTIRFELYRVMHDVNVVIARGHGSDFELECRMQRWLAQLSAYEGTLPMDFRARVPALRCRFLFNQLKIAWETYLYGNNVDRKDMDARLSQILAIQEINEKNTRYVKDRPSWALDVAIIPSCLWVAWYWRSPTMVARTRRLFEAYQDYGQPEQVKYTRLVLDYILTLSKTPHNKSTQLEKDLFGYKPRVLQNFHSYRYVDYLIRKIKRKAAKELE